MLIKRTKIVCTMGPACDDDDTLREMIKAGMNVARFNFSHGSYEEHHERMERVKRISKELGMPVGILLDTKGPEIRTGLLEGHAKVELPTGAEVIVTAAETSEDRLGTAEHFYLDHLELPREVHVGGTILIDDGLIGLTVTNIDGQDIRCTVQNGGSLGERKGVNVPNAKLSLPTMTDRDREDILFGLKEGIDFIAASFIRDAEGVREIRKLCDENRGRFAQDRVRYCRLPVRRHSRGRRRHHGRPRRPGRRDRSRGLPDGAEGDHPQVQHGLQAGHHRHADARLHDPQPAPDARRGHRRRQRHRRRHRRRLMANIALIAEATLPEHRTFDLHTDEKGIEVFNNSVGLAAVSTAFNVNARAILVPTFTGRSAGLVSNFRPSLPILAITPYWWAVNKMTLYWGVDPICRPGIVDVRTIVQGSIEEAKKGGYAKEGDIVVLTAGDPATSVTITDQAGAHTTSTNVVYVAQVR